MVRKHSISRIYPVSAETLWNDILDPRALDEAMDGAVTYDGLPSEPVFEGQTIEVSIKRWGWLPMGRWTMEIVRRDDENLILESREFGNIVRSYRHRLEVEALDDETAKYTDFLELDAGIFTALVFPMFRSMYEQRHDERLKRLVRVH